MTLLSLLVSALGSTVVQLPYPLTIHFILAGPKRDPWKPQFDERLWPKGIKLRVNIILDTSEATNLRWPRCTNEAATYLRGIKIVYRSLKPHDIVAFMHAHATLPGMLTRRWRSSGLSCSTVATTFLMSRLAVSTASTTNFGRPINSSRVRSQYRGVVELDVQ